MVKEYIAIEKLTDNGGHIEIVCDLIRCWECRFFRIESCYRKDYPFKNVEYTCVHERSMVYPDPYQHCSFAEREEVQNND